MGAVGRKKVEIADLVVDELSQIEKIWPRI